MQDCKDILSAADMETVLTRLADEVVAAHKGCENLVLMGIQRRGVDIARRLKAIVDAKAGCDLNLGRLDINLYRDDWTSLAVQPTISQTDIPFSIEDREILLVDDVLFTGRTIRAALEAILDYGRPRKVELLVLVDRGNRELPIEANYVGEHVPTQRGEHVNVYVNERDGEDRVCLVA
ncbi:bifunctional pyr operon transcriptional regulator/uracil phosphoribosyltransferase PyrR [Oceanidesulfovibrio marinus]|uniref:Bifunctional protein PyrR n=1 Tax=Oceanidesulfovibrio marinus TaxID=370038 RepID=A0A6P1ZJS2_9BACT|nr:bifunctional pyr operon transcriptional regulator/uracil phosphoribosyltransferase PyrR [Oceanidesulfovibrio marinus]QJT08165.1 bifunctional pyr operon transcriptional regulator/uracil phosphoribosyltransferase PyrR [Oceanidesulfovibrio marinus]TVM35060.1 bifunctional pyr operon transcriptional regulator/uracil phosphoribosyltransferase PyrR [Oceanidesulfovibrio marinus]